MALKPRSPLQKKPAEHRVAEFDLPKPCGFSLVPRPGTTDSALEGRKCLFSWQAVLSVGSVAKKSVRTEGTEMLRALCMKPCEARRTQSPGPVATLLYLLLLGAARRETFERNVCTKLSGRSRVLSGVSMARVNPCPFAPIPLRQPRVQQRDPAVNGFLDGGHALGIVRRAIRARHRHASEPQG